MLVGICNLRHHALRYCPLLFGASVAALRGPGWLLPLAVFMLLLLRADAVLAQAVSVTPVQISDLHDFGSSTDGDSPAGPLLALTNSSGKTVGYLGTTQDGGANSLGTIFEFSTTGVYTDLHDFKGGSSDGSDPRSGVTAGLDGNYYGVTYGGGPSNAGTIFELSSDLSTYTLLTTFSGGSGGPANPVGLVEASANQFYGVTENGGGNGTGSIFGFVPGSVVTAAYDFAGLTNGINTDGAYPVAPPILGADGNIYGTTSQGGNAASGTNFAGKGGTVWRLVPGGAFTVLYTFSAVNSNNVNIDGSSPRGSLLETAADTFLGTCSSGGANGRGNVFSFTFMTSTSSSSYTLTVLHDFTGASDSTGTKNVEGLAPTGAVVQDASGNVYGTCPIGGTYGDGTIFELQPPSTTGDEYAAGVLYTFGSASKDGISPNGNLIIDANGNLFGTDSQGGPYDQNNPGIAPFGGIFFEALVHPPAASADITVSGVTPATVASGGSAVTATVTGSGFDPASVAVWQVTPGAFSPRAATQQLATVFVSATELTVVVPAALTATDSTLNSGGTETHVITVLNADTNMASDGTMPSGKTSFIVTDGNTVPPAITQVAPASVTAGSVATAVTITGTHFYTDDTVTVAGTVLTPTSAGATTITVTVPASLLTKAQALSLSVSSSAGKSNALTLTVNPITTFSAGLQLISLPYDYSSSGASLSSIFGYASPKLATWNTTTAAYAVTPTAPADAIRLGRGYWVRFPAAEGLDFAGTPATAGTPFTISLSKGWNLIGDPFTTAVYGTGIVVVDQSAVSHTYTDAVTNGIIDGTTYSYDLLANEYIPGTSGEVDPYVGYWIYANAPCQLLMNGS